MVYYGHFVLHDEHIVKTVSDFFTFARTLLGEMSPELQAELDPAAEKPEGILESFQSYLRKSPDYDVNDDGRISEEDYKNIEQLLRRMLAWEAKDRITAKDALAMPFFR